MLSALLNKYASRTLLALLLTPCLNSCGGGGISGLLPLKVTRAEVAPNPIPAPSAGTPTPFEIRWQVRNKGYQMQVSTDAGSGYLAASCLDCNNQLVTLSCTSSISSADPSARELNCISNNVQVSLTNYINCPVGKTAWHFNANVLPWTYVSLPDESVVSVELQ